MFSRNKKDQFGELLHDMTVNLKEAANYFSSFSPEKPEDITIFSETINNYESKGDKLVYQMIVVLNDTFITPIEREDLLELTNRIDDVLDAMEKAALSFEICHLSKFNDVITKMAAEISGATDEITAAVDCMFSKKLKEINGHSKKIKQHESNCDDLYREALLDLFQVEEDPIRLIRYKVVYENLEEIANFCEDVSKTLNSIVMKNA
ncbi:DUF47 domain-containing protein [Vagococcus salmoninarum]|uniref:Phosphate transport regulator n=1 Tax=Vagococcus salmoninarum TaxID=2739 RepID=A0A429ZV02_9ENTE|nr:DUF47 family protein [Vagococcus salmoninarum]MBE9390465.1 DUF47 domain-containing protein [Vagococcus salmoninarum]RST97574.1 hypothetical protein CBF35_02595 [Vagococcus salmoninarum]